MYYLVIDACNNSSFLRTLYFIKFILKVICILTPIVLIVKSMMTLTKSLLQQDDKPVYTFLVQKLIVCVSIFLIPSALNLILSFMPNIDFKTCMDMATIENIENFKSQEDAKKEQEIQEKEKSVKSAMETVSAAIKSVQQQIVNTYNSVTTSDGSNTNSRYNLTDAELRHIAAACKREQGSIEGAKAEASLMLNRYELYNKHSDWSFYKYMTTKKDGALGWFAGVRDTSKNSSVSSEYINAVKSVLNGNRTLDLRVDEHDCWLCNKNNRCSGSSLKGDICRIINNGKYITSSSEIKNRNNYIKDVTIINNVYGGTYTFSTFPASNSDPFGYTATASNKVKQRNN